MVLVAWHGLLSNSFIIGDAMLLFISILLIYGLNLHWSLYFVAVVLSVFRVYGLLKLLSKL